MRQLILSLVILLCVNKLAIAQENGYILFDERAIVAGCSFYTQDNLGNEYQVVNDEVQKVALNTPQRSNLG